MKSLLVLTALLLSFTSHTSSAADTISFPSKDGLSITADTYIENPETSPTIVLFHQAGWSRGEYVEIAPRLNKLGFNCIAVDLRSGKSVNGVVNQTAKKAEKEGKSTTYVDAIQDIQASIEYVKKTYNPDKLIIWGSSYSAALVLKIAGESSELVDGILAFAPGEYFSRFGKSGTWIQESAKNIDKPVFITSARAEKGKWKPIFDSIKSKEKVSFIPQTEGNHGSRALWEKFGDSDEYWKEVTGFLKKYFL